MKTANDIFNSPEANKTKCYIDLALSITDVVNSIDENDDFFIRNAKKEVYDYCQKAINADCEYSAYINSHYAGGWLQKIEERM